jgi:hypothetical protein
MLKHRLARRLSTLFMLVAILVAGADAPAASTNRGPFCQYDINDSGQCVIVCCNQWGCSETSC